MVADMTKSFGTLQAELELAKSNLKGLNENIKRIIGRDPTDGPLRLYWLHLFLFIISITCMPIKRAYQQ